MRDGPLTRVYVVRRYGVEKKFRNTSALAILSDVNWRATDPLRIWPEACPEDVMEAGPDVSFNGKFWLRDSRGQIWPKCDT